MITSSLDTICRRWLLERNLPIHYYPSALFHAASALRELSFDTLQIVNSANLPVNSYGAADLPADFVDDVAVCVPVADVLAPLPKQDWITPIRIHDTTSGAFVPYSEQTTTSDGLNNFFGFPTNWSYYWNVSDYAEPTGRRFGAHGGTSQGYKVIKERRQIQLTSNFENSNVIMLYISDGQNADAASQVDTLAISAIHSWIDWKSSSNIAIKNSQEAATFYNEKRRLRQLLNPMTRIDIINTLRNGYTAGIKF